MRPAVSIEVDTSRFDAALKQYLLLTKRDLHKAINSRFFFLLVRLFVLVPPKSPGQERRRIADYLGTPVGDINRKDSKTGKRVGRSRIFRRVHLIAQSRQAKSGDRGLYGERMKKVASELMRKAIGSVGYLRSMVVKGIRVYNRGFAQFESAKRKKLKKPSTAKRIPPTNKVLLALANQYGLPEENVAVHKGTRARGYEAVPGWNPTASISMTAGIADNQVGRVQSIYNPAMQRALNDELAEMEAHIAEALLLNSDSLVQNGIDVK